ncbi:MAG: EamA family transporter [Desulfovibrionaceae bacterium]|nr:EamA family transporter [Desulfovibrionaceae bacterium]
MSPEPGKHALIGKGPLLVIAGALCFSTTGTAQALSPEGATPMVIGALRLCVGGLAMLAWCILTRQIPHISSWPKWITLLSALGILVYQLTFFAAVSRTGVAVGTVVAIGTSPIAAGLLGAMFLREKPQKIWYPATAVAIIGLAFLSLSDNIKADPLGLILALVAGFSYGVYSVFSKSLAGKYSPVQVMTVLFAIGAILITPVFFICPIAWIASPPGILVSLHLGVVTTALAYTLYLSGLKLTPVSAGVTLGLFEPFAAACWGIFLLQEPVMLQHIIGIILLFSSTTLLALKTR